MQLAPTQFWNVSKSDEAGLRACFDAVDIDGSGTIDREEWMSQYRQLYDFFGYPPTVQDAEDLFFVMDTDGNGQVDFEEYKEAITSWTTKKPAFILLTDTQKKAIREGWTKVRDSENKCTFKALEKFIAHSSLFEFMSADDRLALPLSLMNEDETLSWAEYLNGMSLALLSKEQIDLLTMGETVEGDGKMDALD